MSMDPANPASQLISMYDNIKDTNDRQPPDIFIEQMCRILDDEFQKATATLPDIDITTVAGSLVIELGDPSVMAFNIAKGVCEYWADTTAISGIPVLDLIVSVTNDAMDKIQMIESNIMAIPKDAIITPEYLEFTTAIIEPIKTIQWTITEILYTSNGPVTQILTNSVT